MSSYEKDLNSIKHLIASSGNFDTYVDSLDVHGKREFVDDVEYIISKTKIKYKKVLYIHLFISMLVLVSFINLKFNFSGLSAILFISASSVLFPATLKLYKNWKTVRTFKLIKKADLWDQRLLTCYEMFAPEKSMSRETVLSMKGNEELARRGIVLEIPLVETESEDMDDLPF